MNYGQEEGLMLVKMDEWLSLGKEDLREVVNVGGIITYDKPTGISSHDVVNSVRKRCYQQLGMKIKVGHAGTLDPLATGLLIVLIGQAVKMQGQFQDLDKEYECEALMGVRSDTYDVDGVVEFIGGVDRELLEKVRNNFVGYIRQTVPAYSALKQRGKKLYLRAREDTVDWSKLPMRDVWIKKFDILEWELVSSIWLEKIIGLMGDGVWRVKINFEVGSGTYIRSIIHEWGNMGDSDGVVYKLKRLRVGGYYL